MPVFHPFPGERFPEPMSPADEDFYVRAILWPDADRAADPALRRLILGRFYAALLQDADLLVDVEDRPVFEPPSHN